MVRRGELIGELVVAEPEGGVTLGDQDTLVRVEDALDVDAKAETVEQLRAELTLLRIHGADEDEPRRVRERHPLPLDDIDPHGGGIQEHVHDVVVEEVDLVDVEDVAVRLGQHAGLELARPRSQGCLDVDRAHHPVLRGVDGQLDDPHTALVGGKEASRPEPGAAVVAEGLAVVRIAAEVAALDDVVLGEQAGQGPHRGRLAGALLAPDEYPTDRRHDGVQDQGQLHRLLAHDRRERENVAVERDAHAVKNRWGVDRGFTGMELVVVLVAVIGLVLFDVAAWLWGVDSRVTIEDDRSIHPASRRWI